jgi:predicted phosphodiesterase
LGLLCIESSMYHIKVWQQAHFWLSYRRTQQFPQAISLLQTLIGTMKIIVFTDTHANLPALLAFREAISQEGYDEVFHTGDAIDIGPYPSECLEVLLEIPRIQCIMGNHDAWFANGLPEPRPGWMDENELQHCCWTGEQIDPALRQSVKRWPYAFQTDFEGTTVTFVHYGLHENPSDYVPSIKNPTAGDLDRMLGRFWSDLVFYGHDHRPADIEGIGRYINPGALGCSPEPIARYCVIVFEAGKFKVQHKFVPYDDSGLFAEFDSRHVPARQFIIREFFGRR